MSKATAKKVKATDKTKSKIVALAPALRAPIGIHVGTIVRTDQAGFWVDFAANPSGPLIARASVPLSRAHATIDTLAGQSVVLLVEREGAPVILGLLQPLAVPATNKDMEVKVDGRRIEFDAQEEIVLKCGKASIVLRSNGRVEIRGVRVETRAKTVNRIKGGSVAIN